MRPLRGGGRSARLNSTVPEVPAATGDAKRSWLLAANDNVHKKRCVLEWIWQNRSMIGSRDTRAQREAAVELLRALRHIGTDTGVRSSGIAFGVGLLLYEHGVGVPPRQLSVDMITAATGYSGPAARLVLKRLAEAGSVDAGDRVGKTQLYRLTEHGVRAFDAYVEALLAFRAGRPFSGEEGPGPGGGPPAGQGPPPARYAGAPPGPEAAG